MILSKCRAIQFKSYAKYNCGKDEFSKVLRNYREVLKALS